MVEVKLDDILGQLQNSKEIANKDYRRFVEFFVAVKIKRSMLLGEELTAFDSDVASLSVKWIERVFHVGAKVMNYLWSDPFKGERKAVREFIAKWNFASFPEGEIIVKDMG